MNKQKLILFITPLLFLLLAITAYIKLYDKTNTEEKTDAINFKEEYESLNNTNSKFNKKFKTLSIDKENPIEYIDYDKLFKILDSGTGIIYLGYPSCQECRVAIDVLLDVAKENNIETIYYMNIENERDSYTIENNKLVLEKDDKGNEINGTENYFKLVKLLDKYLSDYVVQFNNKEYEVGEKRIHVPSFIFVKDGEVLGVEISIVGSELEGDSKLSDDEYEELFGIYEDYVFDMYSSTCSTDSAC